MFHPKAAKQPNAIVALVAEPILAGLIGGTFNHFSETDVNYQTVQSAAMYAGIVALANLASTQGTRYLMPDIFKTEKLKRIQHAGINAGVTAGLNVWLQSTMQTPKDLRVNHNLIAGAIAGGGASVGAPMVLQFV